MDHAKQRAEQFILVVARGDAHVFRYAAAERVRTHVEATAVKIEAEHFHGFQAQFALCCGRERALRRNKRTLRLLFHDVCQQVRQPGFHIAEQNVQTGAGHVGLKNIQQRVVRRTAFGFRPQARLFTAEFDHLFQVGGKTLPVVSGALRAPGVLAPAARQGFGFHQRFRQQGCLLVVARHFAQVGLFDVIQIFTCRRR